MRGLAGRTGEHTMRARAPAALSARGIEWVGTEMMDHRRLRSSVGGFGVGVARDHET